MSEQNAEEVRDTLIDCITSHHVHGDVAADIADYLLGDESGLAILPARSEQNAEDRERVGAIIHGKCCPGAGLVRGSTVGNCRRAADAVLAALDVPALRAEMERLRRYLRELEAERGDWQGMARIEVGERLGELRLERDALAAKVERVRALAADETACMDLWWNVTGDDWAVPDWLPPKFLRAALNETGSTT